MRTAKSHPDVRPVLVGVYAANTLPSGPRKRKPCAYIVNTDRSYLPGSHWNVIYFDINGEVDFFDSYGRPPPKDFSTLLGDSYNYQEHFIQHPLSSACGQYCIFYVFQRSRGLSMEEILSLFDKDNTLLNDVIVNLTVEKNFNVDLDIFDTKYIAKQICRSWSKDY